MLCADGAGSLHFSWLGFFHYGLMENDSYSVNYWTVAIQPAHYFAGPTTAFGFDRRANGYLIDASTYPWFCTIDVWSLRISSSMS